MKKITKKLRPTGIILCAAILLATGCKRERSLNECESALAENVELPALGNCMGPTLEKGTGTDADTYVYFYTTKGGGRILIGIGQDGMATTTIVYPPYPNFSVQFWGGGHENLNGKHIKDRNGNNRTFVWPDGAKVTLAASGVAGNPTSITIYDGETVLHINTTCKTIEYNGKNGQIARKMDTMQPDGETCTIQLTETGLNFYNEYNEETPCKKIYQNVELGFLRKDNPNQVNDRYDDPRLGHT